MTTSHTQMQPIPDTIDDEAQLEELLSRPSDEVVDLFGRLDGDLVVLGSGGKMGPTLVRMACRARDAAGGQQQIISVSRFADREVRQAQERCGAETVRCDLMDPEAVGALPDARYAIYMAGLKFGTSINPPLTWAVNTLAPAFTALRFRDADVVAFSTGCVYPLVPTASAGSVESDALEPVGEYSNACVARERVFDYFAQQYGTRVLHLRLNYAVELRYGVLVDLAQQVLAGEPIDLTMGRFNAIWQADANAAALRLLEHASNPPAALNVTGSDALSVRDVARRLGQLMDKPVTFTNTEAPTALLADTSAADRLLGPPATPIDRVVTWVAHWLARRGRTLGKPTHFQTRDGRF